MSSCGTSPTAPYGDLLEPLVCSTRETDPESASLSPASAVSRVLLPAPLAPTTATSSPGTEQADAVEDPMVAPDDDHLVGEQARPVPTGGCPEPG